MKRHFFCYLMLLALVMPAAAQQRSAGEIKTLATEVFRQKAPVMKNHFNNQAIICTPSSKMINNPFLGEGHEAFYLCTAKGCGAIILSGDERMGRVLAYLDAEDCNTNNLPPGMVDLLQLYARNYLTKKNDVNLMTTPPKRGFMEVGDTTVVGPLITSKWGQGWPYNKDCPHTWVSVVAGCVAVAMSQIMNYYKWPTDSFDWDNILDYYDSNSTAEQRAAVAKLVHECGVAVEMHYGTAVSVANTHNVPTALKNVYGYSSTIADLDRNRANEEYWIEMLKQEFDARRPVYHDGYLEDLRTGHAFIVDGYMDCHDGNMPFFHVNWGSDGEGDGFFQTIGFGLEYNQNAIINIKPDTGFPPSDGGFYQADSQQFTPSVMLQNISQEINLQLTDTRHRSFEQYPGYLIAYLENDSTGERQRINHWLADTCLHSGQYSFDLVCDGLEFTPTLPAGEYELVFYASATEDGADRRVTLGQEPLMVTILDTQLDGDVNGDLKVNISDLDLLIKYLLNGNTDPFIAYNADLNRDNHISIADVTRLINILLNEP